MHRVDNLVDDKRCAIVPVMYSYFMSAKKRDWLIAFGYVFLIYATLEVARLPLAFLRAHGILRISLGILFSIATSIVVSLIVRQRPLKFWKFFLLLLIGLAYFFSAKHVQTPEEQVHFFEYGLVGFFFLRALMHDLGLSIKSLLLALLLSALAGWGDEILQGLSPHRQYDIRDVALNAVSAALGLALYLICKSSDSH